MPLLDATNDTIDFGDCSPNASATSSDSNHWTLLADEPNIATNGCVVVDNKVQIAPGSKLFSVRNAGTKVFEVNGAGDVLIQNTSGASVATVAGQPLNLRGNTPDGASAVGVKVGCTAALSTQGAKIVSFYSDQFITEKAYIDVTGQVACNNVVRQASAALGLSGNIADGGTAIAVKIGNIFSLSTTAKIASFYSDAFATEAAYVRNDGNVGCAGLFPAATAANMLIRGSIADGPSAVGTKFGNTNALSNATAKIVTFCSDSFATEKAAIGAHGKFIWPTGGADAVVGKSALVAGTVTVSTTSVAANSVIFLTRGVVGGTVGDLSVGTITAGTSFVINSANAADTSTINWLVTN